MLALPASTNFALTVPNLVITYGTICIELREWRFVSLKHLRHRTLNWIRNLSLVTISKHLPKPSRIIISVTHWPERRTGKPPFPVHQAVQEAIKRVVLISWVYSHWYMYCDRLGLSDPVHSVVALFLDGRIPPARQMNNMRGSCQR